MDMILSRYRSVVVVVWLVGAFCCPEANADMSYQIIELGTLGGSTSTGRDINSSGQVVGHSHIAGDAVQHAFIWDMDNGMRDLGTPPGWPSGQDYRAYTVNDSGQAAGAAGLPGYLQHAVFWDPVLGAVDLGTLGGNRSFAFGINNSAHVVGGSRFEPGNNTAHGFLWTPAGGMTDLGTLGANTTSAYAINDNGQIAGYSEGPVFGGAMHAVFWDPVAGIIDLGTLGGDYSNVADIGSDGTVIGNSTVSDGSVRPFAWDSKNGMRDLGTLGGTEGNASGINDAGQVVGFSSTTDGSWRAFIWDADRGMLDLNTYLAPDSPWELQMADAINGSGQIVGFGEYEGQRRAFLMTPDVIPLPSAVVLGVMGLGMAQWRLRRRRTV